MVQEVPCNNTRHLEWRIDVGSPDSQEQLIEKIRFAGSQQSLTRKHVLAAQEVLGIVTLRNLEAVGRILK